MALHMLDNFEESVAPSAPCSPILVVNNVNTLLCYSVGCDSSLRQYPEHY